MHCVNLRAKRILSLSLDLWVGVELDDAAYVRLVVPVQVIETHHEGCEDDDQDRHEPRNVLQEEKVKV